MYLKKQIVCSVPAPESVPDPVTITLAQFASKHPEPAPEIPESSPVVSKCVVPSSTDAGDSDLDMTMDKNYKVTSWLSKQAVKSRANPHPKQNKPTTDVTVVKSRPATALSGTSLVNGRVRDSMC